MSREEKVCQGFSTIVKIKSKKSTSLSHSSKGKYEY